jgi:deaminated glutathione amidase
MRVLRVACVQLNTRGDVAANVAAVEDLVEAAAAEGARLVALPETWSYKGGHAGIAAAAEAVSGPSNAAMARLAARLDIFVLSGSIYEPSPAADLFYNTSALFGPDGSLLAVYRKIHLFDAVSGAKVYRESDDVAAGDELVTAEVDGVHLGLTICYDLRFPELYRSLALRGAEVLCVPAAFTAPTGEAHWHVLLRARAIENGCCVVAPGQVGEHLPGRECYGHSLIADPWGEVLAEVGGDQPGLCVADLDLGRLAKDREQLPVLRHRRPDVYEL